MKVVDQAGRHVLFYYTSTKCAIPDDMAGQHGDHFFCDHSYFRPFCWRTQSACRSSDAMKLCKKKSLTKYAYTPKQLLMGVWVTASSEDVLSSHTFMPYVWCTASHVFFPKHTLLLYFIPCSFPLLGVPSYLWQKVFHKREHKRKDNMIRHVLLTFFLCYIARLFFDLVIKVYNNLDLVIKV